MPASAMSFKLAGTDHRSHDASWIQADGPIETGTVDAFIQFFDEGPDWLPKRIRFNSPGGVLFEGIRLGEELRRRGFATEVGGDEVDPEWIGTGSWTFTRRTPGSCASACAYAFMGGVERRIDPGSAIGVHQFYSAARATAGEPDSPALVEEGLEQEISAMLLSYVLEMGVDGRIFVNAGLSSPSEMFWIESGESALSTGLAYSPTSWMPWEIDLLNDGVVAISERQDGKFRMSAFCTNQRGAFFDIFMTDERSDDGSWSLKEWIVDQCLPMGDMTAGKGARFVIGNRVTTENTRVIDHPDGFSVRFGLGRNPEVGTDPSFLYANDYGACLTERFTGSSLRIVPAIKTAFENCIQ